MMTIGMSSNPSGGMLSVGRKRKTKNSLKISQREKERVTQFTNIYTIVLNA